MEEESFFSLWLTHPFLQPSSSSLYNSSQAAGDGLGVNYDQKGYAILGGLTADSVGDSNGSQESEPYQSNITLNRERIGFPIMLLLFFFLFEPFKREQE